jgi:hypothetical protein
MGRSLADPATGEWSIITTYYNWPPNAKGYKIPQKCFLDLPNALPAQKTGEASFHGVFVILSEAKNLGNFWEILRFAQNDTIRPDSWPRRSKPSPLTRDGACGTWWH